MLGRSWSGYTTKLHARCDGKGRPLRFVLTPGQAHDVQGFGSSLGMPTYRIEALLAGTGYCADAIRDEIANTAADAVIPAKINSRTPILHNRKDYRRRNLIERPFNKLKNWRRVAICFDESHNPISLFGIRNKNNRVVNRRLDSLVKEAFAAGVINAGLNDLPKARRAVPAPAPVGWPSARPSGS